MPRMPWLAAMVVAGLVLGGGSAAAQSALQGVVRDASGAVLPGVTVTASSDVLIEKTKTTVTDAQGLYRIVDLRPGVYTVTFELAGFNGFKREGLQIAAEFTATVNADMRLGGIEETITVTGASPVVDITTAARAQVLDRRPSTPFPPGAASRAWRSWCPASA